MRELALRRVDAAVHHVEHQVHALLLAEPVALALGRDQCRGEVVARVAAPLLDQVPDVRLELDRRLLELLAARHHGDRVELALQEVREPCRRGPVLERRAHDGCDHLCRVRRGELRDELAAAALGQRLEQLRPAARASRAGSGRPPWA